MASSAALHRTEFGSPLFLCFLLLLLQASFASSAATSVVENAPSSMLPSREMETSNAASFQMRASNAGFFQLGATCLPIRAYNVEVTGSIDDELEKLATGISVPVFKMDLGYGDDYRLEHRHICALRERLWALERRWDEMTPAQWEAFEATRQQLVQRNKNVRELDVEGLNFPITDADPATIALSTKNEGMRELDLLGIRLPWKKERDTTERSIGDDIKELAREARKSIFRMEWRDAKLRILELEQRGWVLEQRWDEMTPAQWKALIAAREQVEQRNVDIRELEY